MSKTILRHTLHVWVHKASLSTPHFIEVSVSSTGNGQ